MTQPNAGVFLASTITVEASGTAIFPSNFSNVPFKNLGLTVKPLDHTTNYRVRIYFDGELEEDHTYPTPPNTSVICHMNFPDMVFPSNAGNATHPQFFNPDRYDPMGIGVSFVIDNLSSTAKTFYLYVCFEAFDNCRFGKLPQV